MSKEKLTLKIEKIIYGGLSFGKSENYPIFIEGGCPGDTVKIEITKKNKSYGLGKIIEIEHASSKRVKPICPLHNICGGCGLQHIEYEEQLRQKTNIVKETISKIYGQEVTILPIKAPLKNIEYRYKIQYPISQTKVSKRIIAGYYKQGTHDAVNIKYCPVQPQIIDKIIDYIREKAVLSGVSGYDEKRHCGILRHVVIRMSKSNGKILVTLVINDNKISQSIRTLAQYIFKFENITGVVANFNTQKTNVITGKQTKTIVGTDYTEEKIGSIIYKISSNSFFQVNPESAEILFNTAKDMIQEEKIKNPIILDAYSGVSAFALQLKDIAREIVCVEESKSSTEDAKYNIKINKAENITIINDDAAKIFSEFEKEGRLFDIIILDPPRKGCSKDSLDFAAKLSKNIIIYVSCNPSSLAADLKYLKERGFQAEKIQPVDMFCHTPHIESVALIKRIQNR